MDESELHMLALAVIIEIQDTVSQDSDEELVEFDEICEFINTTDQTTLYRLLREDSSASDEAAAVLSPQSTVADDVFFTLRKLCGGVEMIGTDPEKQAEVEALSTILGDIAEGEPPPAIDDLTATEVAVDEAAVRVTSAEMQDWLAAVQPRRFYAAWGSVPSIYEDEIRTLVESSSESELLFGSRVMEAMTEELVNTHPAIPTSRTVRHWLNSIALHNPVAMYESAENVPFSICIFDDWVVVGYFAHEKYPEGAFLRTADSEFRKWAVELFEKWRASSQEIQPPMSFRGTNPYTDGQNDHN
ncbi:hypothetical protein [Halococcus sp. AFM35]|uniref:transcriptional regulator FilR1 domain-containing protein n=1 Tax=Halococcus sp. AFM35 TaxID=3421653 RepID=UPI003EBA56D9